jgi:hypothetical protein
MSPLTRSEVLSAAAITAGLDPAAPEPDRRVLIAKCVAAQARPEYRADVEARKTTIATGSGSVHGVAYTLASWGLDETAA